MAEEKKGLFSRFFKKKDISADVELPSPPNDISKPAIPPLESKKLDIEDQISDIQKEIDGKEDDDFAQLRAVLSEDEPKEPAEEPEEAPEVPVEEESEPDLEPVEEKDEDMGVEEEPEPKPVKVQKQAPKSIPKPVPKPAPKPEPKVKPAPVSVEEPKFDPLTLKVLSKDQKGKIILREQKNLAKVKADVATRLRDVREEERTFGQKYKNLKALDQKLAKDKKALDDEEDSLIEKVKSIEKEEKLLESRQKAIAPRLATLDRNESFIKKKIQELNDRERDIVAKEQEQKKTIALLDDKEKQIVTDLDKIERDRKLIDEKAEEIEKIFDEIQKNRGLLSKQDSEIRQRKAQLDKLNSEYQEKKDSLNDLDKEITEREAAVEAKERHASDLVAQAKKMQAHKEALGQMEKTYVRLKQKLKDEYHKLEQIYNKRVVLEKGGSFTEEDIAEFTRLKAAKEANPNHAEIADEHLQEFVEETSALVQKGDYVDANQNLAQLIAKHHKMEETSPYKKEVYYDILRLKHELKLALLK
jgi:hypothetical protein